MRGVANRLGKPHILATNGTIHDQISALFVEVFNGHYRVPLPQVSDYQE
jgi:hypothetical protein